MHRALLERLRCPATGSPLWVQPLRVRGDDIEFALLHGSVLPYPVVDGIPVFTSAAGELVDLVRERRFDDAVARACYGHLSWGRLTPALRAIGETFGRLRRSTGAAQRLIADREMRRAGSLLVGLDGRGPDVRALEHAYLRSRRPNPDGFDYFMFRMGTPRHLVALSLIDAVSVPDGATLDLGCGLGHLTAALADRRPGSVVGVDTDYLGLAFAAARVAPGASFVCADARRLPFADGTFTMTLSSDVLPYVTQKRTVVDELRRVSTADAVLVCTALRNRHAQHVHGGEPLSPGAWTTLLENRHQLLFGDAGVLARYRDRLGPVPVSPDAACTEQTVSIVSSPGDLHVDSGTFGRWPHARGTLAVHPLLRPSAGDPARSVCYERRFPSDTFARDHPLLGTYLPPEVTIPRAAVDQARSGEVGPELAGALAQVAVLGVPHALVDDPWPGFELADAP